MAPCKGKRMPHEPSNRNLPHQTPALTCFLDLPLELRLMIYRYAIDYYEVRWTVTFEPRSGFMLALGDLHNEIRRRDTKPLVHHRPLSLLRACRLVYQETLPILYSRTQFVICFDTCLCEGFRLMETHSRAEYQLQLTNGRSQLTRGLAQVVLQRVKHVCIFLNDRFMSTYLWRMHILSTCLRHGMGLESLRFVSAGYTADIDDVWGAAEVLHFDSFKNTAVLEFLHSDIVKGDMDKFKKFQRSLGRVLSVSIKQYSSWPPDGLLGWGP